MYTTVTQVVSSIIAVLIIFAGGIAAGAFYQKKDIVNYCKADQAYLSEGLMMQCAVIESRLNKSV